MNNDSDGHWIREVFPGTLLILGTDLAGKDHVANLLVDAARARGLAVERRRGSLRAAPSAERTSEHKGLLRLWAERAFLATLPLHRPLIPLVAAVLLWSDARLFRRPTGKALIVVSHTALRLAAFAFGHAFAREAEMLIPPLLDRVLRGLIPATGMRVLVLDIDHAVRERRLAARLARGTLDHFDRYMAEDPVRSERIEAMLARLATTYLGATLIENNDRSDQELLERIGAALRGPSSPPRV